jgi:hypothetical protein
LLALAIFIVMIVWPLRHRLQAPKLLALAITIVITVAVCPPSLRWRSGASAKWDDQSSQARHDIRRCTTP